MDNLLVRQTPVLILGDYMRDEYIEGACARLSPEAPVPVVMVRPTGGATPGGAGNVALCVAGLNGGRARAVGTVGDDDWGRALRANLSQECVNVDELWCIQGQGTTRKVRVVSGDHHICRLDYEGFFPVCTVADAMRPVYDRLEKDPETDLLLMADYDKGALGMDLWLRLRTWRTKLLTFASVKPRTLRHVPPGLDCLWMNEAEMREGARLVECCTGAESLPVQAERLREEMGSKLLCVTLGSRGILVAERGAQEPVTYPAFKVPVFDVVGAGDAAFAAFALAWRAFRDVGKAARVANAAGACAVSHPRLHRPCWAELVERMGEDAKRLAC